MKRFEKYNRRMIKTSEYFVCGMGEVVGYSVDLNRDLVIITYTDEFINRGNVTVPFTTFAKRLKKVK